MKDKPDFDKIIIEVFSGDSVYDKVRCFSALEYGSHEKILCKKIWNNFVLPEIEQSAYLAESYSKLQIRLGESESEVNRLKSELYKAKELLSESTRFSTSVLHSIAINDFLKDKK